MKHIVILNYPGGNTASIQNAIQYCEPAARITVTENATTLRDSDAIILPGQGSMSPCMHFFHQQKMAQNFYDMLHVNKPVLGICLGMQILMQYSEECADQKGLQILEGYAKKIDTKKNIVPHMGWNQVKQTKPHSIWHNIPDNANFYYANSYHLWQNNNAHEIGRTTYGETWSSAIAFKKVVACQFHPEKSHKNGLQFIKNFLNGV